MRDVIMLAVTTAFFALCLAYVRWCDHIIGPDPIDPVAGEPTSREHLGTFDVEEVSA
jgi:hypothetical protein